MPHKNDNLTVLGAGVLGAQIAWHSAYKGKQVVVYDLFDEALERCKQHHQQYAEQYKLDLGASDADMQVTQTRVRYTSDLADAVANADVVIEAVPEIPDVKKDLYSKLAPLLPEHTIVASNSSTLLPSMFAEYTGRPEKFCALHFANLIWMSNLAEIMAHPGTARETLEQITEFAIEIGMVPIAVQKEQNGYLLNTWLVALLNSAQTLVTNGVGTPEDVDRTFLIINRGAQMGPFGIMDVVGIKTCFDILSHWGEVNNDDQMRKNAAYYKEHFLDQGKQGMLGGEGYYKYPNPAFAQEGFLDVPDKSVVSSIVERTSFK